MELAISLVYFLFFFSYVIMRGFPHEGGCALEFVRIQQGTF